MLIPSAYAQTAGAAAQSGGPFGTYAFVIQMVLLGAVFYFLMIRPQQKRAKAHKATIDAVKKGDSIVTSGGILGKVTKVEDAFVEVEIAPTVKVRVVKATLTEVIAPGTAKPAND